MPDARHGLVTLTSSGGPFKVLAGEALLRSVSWTTFDERQTSLRSWGIDACADEALVGVDHGTASSWLYVQRGGRWTEVTASPVQPVSAHLEGDDVVIRAKDGRQLRRALSGAAWVEEAPSVAIPLEATRVLPIGSSLAIEMPSGVALGATQLAPAGSKLLGVSGRYVIIKTTMGVEALPAF